MVIKTYDIGKNRFVSVGVVRNNTLFKQVIRKIHHFRKLHGYAIQAEVIDRLRGWIDSVEIIEADTGRHYLSDLDDWTAKGHLINFGHGEQIVLECRHMEVK